MAVEQPIRVGLDREGKDSGVVYLEYIPQALLHHPQWVCWRYVDRGKGRKPDKQPVNPRTLGNAGVHWPNTWTAFDEAYATYLRHYNRNLHGIGFVLTETDPYVALDLDDCIHDDEIGSRAAQVINEVRSYTEISPSGRGLRIPVACPGFQDNARRGGIEVYSHSRYVTVTGQHVAGTPVTICPASPDFITGLVPPQPVYISSPSQHVATSEQYPLSDVDLWEHIFAHDRYGHHHLQRFQGDSSLDRGDHSFTVIRLLNCLAGWTHCDPIRMRSMMLSSSLANDKWFEKRGAGDWLDYQIADAVAYVSGRQGI